MSYVHPLAAEHLRRRWTRHDAWRFAPPGSPEAKMPGEWPTRMALADDAQDADDTALATELAALRTSHDRLRGALAELKSELAWRRFVRKYSSDQPRVPAGNPDGGQWTAGPGSGEASRVRLAGDPPTNDPPEVPKNQPSASREARIVLRSVARWLSRYGGPLGKVAAAAYWLYEYQAEVTAAADPPKSLQELHDAVDDPRPGYQRHHIVEQTWARYDGFPESQIEARDNLVRIPTLKHEQITAWFQTGNEDFGGLSPRRYLAGKSWDERRAVGLRAMIKFGVLKP